MNHAGPRAFHMSFVRVVLLWNMAIKPSRASSPNLWFLGGAGARICLDSAAKRLNTNKQRVTMIQCILNCILLCQQFLNAHCETNLYGTLSYSIDSFTPTLSNNKPENGTRIISRKEQSLMCVFDCSCAVIDSPPSPPHTPGKTRTPKALPLNLRGQLHLKPSCSQYLHTIRYRFHVAPSFCVMRFSVLTLRLLRRPDAKEMMPAEDKWFCLEKGHLPSTASYTLY